MPYVIPVKTCLFSILVYISGMAMFVKMLLAFVMTVFLAGAAVYFGTNYIEHTDNASVKELETPSSQTHLPNAKKFLDKYIKKTPISIPAQQELKPPADDKPNKNEPAITTPEIFADKSVILEKLVLQAGQIKSESLRDQALLDIVNYAVNFRDFDGASAAMKKIEQVELRDTARGNIAIFMARSGMADQAFEIIDQVEIDTLRDVLRLQVIEAIAMPGRMLPKTQR